MRLTAQKLVIVAALSLVVLAGYSTPQGELDLPVFVLEHGRETVLGEIAAEASVSTSATEAENSMSATDAAADQYFSIGSEAFVPGSSVKYTNTYGRGGAYFQEAISGAMVAHVHLPHGAVVKEFTAYFYDKSQRDLRVHLDGLRLDGGVGAYYSLASVTSAGVVGYGSKSTTSNAVIDNTMRGYLIYVWGEPWDASGNLRIRGAIIRYSAVPGSIAAVGTN